MNKANLLILERSMSEITINEEAKASGNYILEGIFSIMGKKNKNNRIYDEAEFVPHIEEMAKKVAGRKILGELDHPKQFEVSLKNVSHVIEEISYNKETKEVRGKIRLLDTVAGKQAKALVDAGVPIHISSRAAGVVKENGHVQIKRLFTYDLVNDPGVEEAQLNLVNESLGLDLDDTIKVYQIDEAELNEDGELLTDTTATNETTVVDDTTKKDKSTMKTNEGNFITQEDFNEYTKIVKENFQGLQKNLNSLQEGLKTSTADISNDGELIKYVEKVAEQVNALTDNLTENTSNIDNLISHNDYIIEGLEQVKDYSELVGLKTDQGIEYTKKVAESQDNAIEYTKLLAERLDQSIEYAKVIAETLDNGIGYSEETNEHLDKLTEYTKSISETVDARMRYQDGINENTDNLISHNDYIIEQMGGISNYQNYLKESLETLGTYTETIVEQINEDNGFKGKEKLTSIDESNNNQEAFTAIETLEEDKWKNGISEQISALVESATKQKAVEESANPHFLQFLSESKRLDYTSLEEDKRTLVLEAFDKTSYFGSADAERIYEGVFVNDTPKIDWLMDMPSKYQTLWESLTNEAKDEIKSQASISRLDSQYRIDHFWSTRDLRSQSVNLNEDKSHATDKKVVAVNESTLTNNTDYMNQVAADLKRRMGR